MSATKRFLFSVVLAGAAACGGATEEPVPQEEPEQVQTEEEDLTPLEPQLWPGPCVSERFEGGVQTSRTTNWFDRKLRYLRSQSESFVDGTFEPSTVGYWTYDDESLTGTVTRWEAGETPYEFDEMAYDDRGNLVRVEHRGGQYLEPQATEIWDYQVIDGEDRLTRHAKFMVGSDEPYEDVVYKFDDQGRPSSSYVLHSGSVTETERFYIEGKLKKSVTTRDGTERATVYEYNGEQISQEKTDEGNDQIYEQIIDYTYDDHGSVIRLDYDDNADGVPERSTVFGFEYDENGWVTRRTRDAENDGALESEVRTTYHANGQAQREELYSDGEPDAIVHEYDEHGNETLWILPLGDLDDMEIRRSYECWLDLQPPPEIEIPEIPEPGEALCIETDDQWKTACHAGYRVAGEQDNAEAITVDLVEQRSELAASNVIREYRPNGDYFAYRTSGNDDLALRVAVTADANGQPVVEESWGAKGWMRFDTTPGLPLTVLLERRYDDMEMIVEGYADGSVGAQSGAPSMLSEAACGIEFDQRFDFVPESDVTDIFVSVRKVVDEPGGLYSSGPLVFHISQPTECQVD